jgi:hypothetical protein
MSSLTHSYCKVYSKRYNPAACCKCPSAKKPYPVKRCWKLYPKLRPKWAKSRKASSTATANVAIAKDAGNSFRAPCGNTPGWGATIYLWVLSYYD